LLREGGLQVRLHNEIFTEKSAQDSVADEIWIRHCGLNGWVALTRDNDITRTPSSVAAAMESGARLFVLRGAMRFPDLARQFVDAREKVERFLAHHRTAFIAKVKRETFPRGGGRFVVQVELFLDYETWKARSEGRR